MDPHLEDPPLSQQRSTSNQPQSRRERRAAERSGRTPVVAPKGPSPFANPIVWLSLAAVVVGAVIIGVVAIGSGAATKVVGGIAEPTDPTPKELWDGRSIGPANAPIQILMFEDYQCPSCEIFTTQTEPELVKDYVSKGLARLTFKDFAFLGPESIDAAVAARCAGVQGLFWPYHDYLFANQGKENSGHLSADLLTTIATKVGADTTAWSACFADPAQKDAVGQDVAEGQAAGVEATPTLIVNGQLIRGVPGYRDLQAKLDEILASGASAAPSASASQ